MRHQVGMMSYEGTEVYLGDGVYASWDGYCYITLTTGSGGSEQTILLEPAVWENLRLFVESMQK